MPAFTKRVTHIRYIYFLYSRKIAGKSLVFLTPCYDFLLQLIDTKNILLSRSPVALALSVWGHGSATSGDGNATTTTGSGPDPSFRSRQPIRRRRLPRHVEDRRNRPIDEP